MRTLVLALLVGSVSAGAQAVDVPALIRTLDASSSSCSRTCPGGADAALTVGSAAAPAIPALFDVLKTDDGLEELTTTYTPERVFAFNPVQNIAVRVLVGIGTPAIAPIEEALKTADPKGPQLSWRWQKRSPGCSAPMRRRSSTASCTTSGPTSAARPQTSSSTARTHRRSRCSSPRSPTAMPVVVRFLAAAASAREDHGPAAR